MVRTISIIFMTLLLTTWSDAQDSSKRQDPDLETEAVRQLGKGGQGLEKIAKKILILSPKKRRKLPFKVSKKSVELTLQGFYPAGFAMPGSLEYIYAPAGHKDWETLLALSKSEWQRALKFGQAINKLRKNKRRYSLEIDLLWIESGKIRIENIKDILQLAPKKKRAEFLSTLAFTSYGLRATNIKGDPATLPKSKQKVQLRIRITLGP